MKRTGKLGVVSAFHGWEVGVKDIIVKWVNGQKLNAEEAKALLDVYHMEGITNFYMYVKTIMPKYMTEQQVYSALQGQALVHEIPITFIAADK